MLYANNCNIQPTHNNIKTKILRMAISAKHLTLWKTTKNGLMQAYLQCSETHRGNTQA